MKRKSAIKIKHLSKQMNQQSIIHDVNLTIPTKCIYGLIGPNGSGKTTLFKMILGLMTPTTGQIQYKHGLTKKEIGSLIEMPSLYPYMTGQENLDYFADFFGVRQTDFTEIIKELDVKPYLNKKVSAYSLGMKQRLGIVISLLKNPKVLILDEPTNGLDPEGVYDLRHFLVKLVKEKDMTIIVSSHDLNQMELICDQITFIESGQIIKQESTTQTLPTWQIECSKTLEAAELLSVKFKDDFVYIQCPKKELPYILKTLIEKHIDIFTVQEEKNSLEQDYLKLFSKKEANS